MGYILSSTTSVGKPTLTLHHKNNGDGYLLIHGKISVNLFYQFVYGSAEYSGDRGFPSQKFSNAESASMPWYRFHYAIRIR